MASEYNYDEGANTWPYFVLALLVFVLLPLTIKWLLEVISIRESPKKTKGEIEQNHKSLGLPHSEELGKFSSRRRTDRFMNKTLLLIVVGWALVAYIWKTYAKEVSLQGLFDPHTILDLPYTATDREIKSRYRKLSLTYHPDKIARDLSDEAKQEMEAAFIKINLAYKALTDEVTKNNLKLYGHPDGKQDITHGIAIPKFLVEGKYSPFMIVIYFLLIGVLLPALVGSWWNNVKSYTRKGLHIETATLFVRKLTDKNPGKVITPYDILDWILLSYEITNKYSHLSQEQAKALVMDHIDRKYPGKNTPDMLSIIAELPDLIKGFIDIASVFRVPDVIISAYELQKALVQASSPVGKHKELLQLPFVDKETVEAQDVKKLGKLLTLSKEEAAKTLGIKDDTKLEIALSVAKKIPFIRVLDASFRVPGEDIVPPNSSCHLVIKFLIRSPQLKSCPEIEDSRLVEEETIEDLKNPLRSNDDGPDLPAAYAPYFPSKFRNSWEGFIINQRDNKLVEGSEPAVMSKVDLSNLELSQKEWIEAADDKLIISTFKIKLNVPTPPSIGKYHFRLLLKNNAYFGSDVDIPLEMNVTNPPVDIEAVKKASEQEDDDSDSDISDPEEDSLAGALAALRGENVKKSSEDVEESDVESVFTDINTDTEDEAEK
ncbi:DnaJ domain family protein [Clavispora lusitaniae]|uniref:J domain-containing protein n=2 Tax=Clavispora lusitaniae TaxID=36911 RepID=C4Y6C2_CLAL4|nr:uncharacterized protein CLUG_03705 [Clavispora lusitaniae ATCC 42720]EEQ39577.1 hypothetical protein CLUG_03705 [Clavispora lusitaniae ATCC 42720]KAF5210450.1 secretory subunit [Clavispora lusitaniae]KAF7582453.1 DnaJ domain family protein [Clavispora lusitaniae]OVF11000.1 putative protein-transporting protein [Clavispora lusitaniae]